jgi:putative ABC transport system ATP-binding protein
MCIELKQVVPFVLKDRLLHKTSNVWNTNLTLFPGEYIKIQAPSGTGKTTFINVLYSIRKDYTGSILIDEKSLQNISVNELAIMRQNKLSVVFQNLQLFPNLSAFENIELKRLLSPSYCSTEKIEWMAETLGIKKLLQQKAGTCSFGEQQRIAILRALVQPFKWLLMDEPFSHLDDSNIAKATALIDDECKARNAGLIIADLETDKYFNYSQQYFL